MDRIIRFVVNNCKKLRASDMAFADIYRIGFDAPEKKMIEYTEALYDRSLTYGEVHSMCECAAASIAAKVGGTGRFIGLYGENSAEWIVLFWAILRSGNKPFLINTVQPKSFTKDLMAVLDADTLIYTGKAPEIAAAEISFGSLDISSGLSVEAECAFGNEIALSTSGTTLKEKICIYTGKEISEQILNCEEILKLNPDMRRFYKGELKMLMLLPLYHIFGLEATFLWFVFFGVTFVMLPSKEPSAILSTIRNRNVTHVFAVPLFWRTVEKSILKELKSRSDKEKAKFEKAKLLSLKLQRFSTALGRAFARKAMRPIRSVLFGDSIRFCISGGSYLNDSTLELINALGYPLCNGYGMSEIGITSVELSRKVGDRLKNSVGKPFGSVRYSIDNEGRLCVCGESVCKKLLINGTVTEQSGYFNTGDMAFTDGDGRYYISGRESDLVFDSSGEKLNPDAAERAFDIPFASAFSVLGDKNNERLIMVIQLPEKLVDIQRRCISDAFEACNDALPMAYRVRKVYYTYDCILPEGGIKVSRALLRESIDNGLVRLFDSAADEAGAADLCGNDTESVIRSIIAEILDIKPDKIPERAHFIYDLGGSSLDYLTLISAIDNRFDVTMDYEENGFGYCLEDLVHCVEERLSK